MPNSRSCGTDCQPTCPPPHRPHSQATCTVSPAGRCGRGCHQPGWHLQLKRRAHVSLLPLGHTPQPSGRRRAGELTVEGGGRAQDTCAGQTSPSSSDPQDVREQRTCRAPAYQCHGAVGQPPASSAIRGGCSPARDLFRSPLCPTSRFSWAWSGGTHQEHVEPLLSGGRRSPTRAFRDGNCPSERSRGRRTREELPKHRWGSGELRRSPLPLHNFKVQPLT